MSIEEIIRKHFPAGNNWNYVRYDAGLTDVVIDGQFDLKPLVDDIETELERVREGERKRILHLLNTAGSLEQIREARNTDTATHDLTMGVVRGLINLQ